MEWAPVLYRAGVVAAPHRVTHVYLELAVLIRALEGLTSSVRLGTAPGPFVSLGGALRPAREPSRTALWTTCARLPPSPRLTVVGSVNLDLVARVERLPRPGETVTDAPLMRVPGGKGANQAVGAARLGADVRFLERSARTIFAEPALAGLREAGVELEVAERDQTGIALIVVAATGRTRSWSCRARTRRSTRSAAATSSASWRSRSKRSKANAAAADSFCLNAAPAKPIDVEPDLLVVNRYERELTRAADWSR